MPNFQTIVLDTATPQLRAPGTGDGYSFNSGATNLGVWTTTGLGIGTSSPSSALEVSSGSDTVLTINAANNADAKLVFSEAGSAEYSIIMDGLSGSTQSLQFYNNRTATEAMRISSAGNVGIGTSSPTAVANGIGLTVGSGVASSNAAIVINGGSDSSRGSVLRFDRSGTAFGFIGNAGAIEGGSSSALAFSANSAGTIAMRLDSSGNLGLGVTPSAWGTSTRRAIQINSGSIDSGSATGSNVAIRSNEYFDGTNNVYINTQAAAAYIQNNGQHAFYTAPSGTAGTNVSYTQALTLNTSGNLGLGTTSFGTSAVKVLSIGSGTEPSSGPADTVQFYSVDRSAGNTIPAFYCEGSGVINAGITDTTVTHKIAMKINGTIYYLLATTSAT